MLVVFQKLAYVTHESYCKILTLVAELLIKWRKASRSTVLDIC